MADYRRVDDLGRVVIPKGVRTILGIEEGDELDVQIAGDMVCYRKHREPEMIEVVRCRECKYAEVSSMGHLSICKHLKGMVDPNPDAYCSYGARREAQDG